MKYDDYNREERSLCAHLFRLLHENLASDPANSGLARFLRAIRHTKPDSAPDPEKLRWENVAIHCEVALIRDGYFARKPAKDESQDRLNSHMDALVKLISMQEKVEPDFLYSTMPSELGLNDPNRTHPKQIALKGRFLFADKADEQIYGELQAMFNAKPDLAITVEDWLIVLEAKFTEPFNSSQLQRTEKIAQIWQELFFKDLGFVKPPKTCVLCLGLEKNFSKQERPSISWESVAKIASEMYPNERDRSRIAFESAVEFGLNR